MTRDQTVAKPSCKRAFLAHRANVSAIGMSMMPNCANASAGTISEREQRFCAQASVYGCRVRLRGVQNTTHVTSTPISIDRFVPSLWSCSSRVASNGDAFWRASPTGASTGGSPDASAITHWERPAETRTTTAGRQGGSVVSDWATSARSSVITAARSMQGGGRLKGVSVNWLFFLSARGDARGHGPRKGKWTVVFWGWWWLGGISPEHPHRPRIVRCPLTYHRPASVTPPTGG